MRGNENRSGMKIFIFFGKQTKKLLFRCYYIVNKRIETTKLFEYKLQFLNKFILHFFNIKCD